MIETTQSVFAADGSVAGDLLEVEQLARRSRRVNPSHNRRP